MLFVLFALVAPAAASQMSTASLSIGGHLEGAVICAGKPQTILEHTVSPGASGAVLKYVLVVVLQWCCWCCWCWCWCCCCCCCCCCC